MNYSSETEAMKDMAVELIAWMREHKDSASLEMVRGINEQFNLDLDDDIRELDELVVSG